MSKELQNKPLKKGKTLFLFDIDGTLCEPKLEVKESMTQLLKTLSEKKDIHKPFVCFTMDDGYLDNYTKALPVFERYQVPFAIFVSTDFIDKKAILWWDTLEDLILTNDVKYNSSKKYERIIRKRKI